MLALQLDDRTESKGIIVLDILTFIKYDVFECVGAENINVISHHPISREYQMEMIEELLRMSFGKCGVAVIFRYRKSREAFSLSSRLWSREVGTTIRVAGLQEFFPCSCL